MRIKWTVKGYITYLISEVADKLKYAMGIYGIKDHVHVDDEIWMNKISLHMERMDDDHIWFRAGQFSFDLFVKKGKLVWQPQAHNDSWDEIVEALGIDR